MPRLYYCPCCAYDLLHHHQHHTRLANAILPEPRACCCIRAYIHECKLSYPRLAPRKAHPLPPASIRS
eukprot:scaffold19917_cov122-Isochrysis_galbana.AAC.1